MKKKAIKIIIFLNLRILQLMMFIFMTTNLVSFNNKNLEKKEKISISSIAEFDLTYDKVDISGIGFLNKMDQNVYIIFDSFNFYNGIENDDPISDMDMFSNTILLFEKNDNLELNYTFNNTTKFPCYYIDTPDPQNWHFSFSFYIKDLKKIIKPKTEYRHKIVINYFLEEDLHKISELLEVDILNAKIQSKNFNTNFYFKIIENNSILDCFESNSRTIDPLLLRKVFEKYVRTIVVEGKIYRIE